MALGQACIAPLPNNRSPPPSCKPAVSPTAFFVLDKNAKVLTTSGSGVSEPPSLLVKSISTPAKMSSAAGGGAAAGRSSRDGVRMPPVDRAEGGSRGIGFVTRPSIDAPSRRPLHRRGSSQSLKLDLDGLDLGARPADVSRKSNMLEDIVSSPTLQPTMISQGSDATALAPDSGKTVMPEQHLQQQQQQVPQQGDGTNADQKTPVDSFFAHLRDCEESNDILPAEDVLGSSSVSDDVEERHSTTLLRALEGTGSEQVLGGFASLGYGYDRSAAMRGSVSSSVPHSPANALSSTIAAKARGSTVARPLMHEEDEAESSPWSTLSVVQHDPLETLDILSIDEMGLHSIDVGSAEDWEGSRLSARLDSCSSCSTHDEIASPLDWTVARSVRRHRKWVVAPSSALTQESIDNAEEVARAVVVSDHLASKVASKDDQPPATFSGMASFELRFLQAGSAAPNCTIILANPQTQRELAVSTPGSASATDAGHSPTSTAPSLLGGSRADDNSTATSADLGWPSLRARTASKPGSSVATTVKRPESLKLSKSHANTAQAEPFVNLESRRPSLGKSVSHESLGVTTPKLPPSAKEVESNASRKSLPPVPLFSAAGTTMSLSASSSSSTGDSTFGHSQLTPIQALPSEGQSPFGDYTLELEGGPQRGRASNLSRMAAVTGDSLGPSPRSSMTEMRGLGSPVLSTIDPARMAAYQRLARGGSPLRESKLAPPPQQQQSNSGSTMSSRKDNNKRISEWFRKKVLPSNSAPLSSLSVSAWDSLQSPSSSIGEGVGVGRASAPAFTQGLPSLSKVPSAKSSKGKSSSSSKTSSGRPSVNSPPAARVSQFAFSPPSSDAETKEGVQGRRGLRKVNSIAAFQKRPDSAPETSENEHPRAATPALGSVLSRSNLGTNQQAAMWPHLRGDRRRSSSDDNIAALADFARRREREEASAAKRFVALSSSTQTKDMPLSPPLSAHNSAPSAPWNSDSHSRVPVMINSGLIGIDNVPADAVTMVIPLPVASASFSSVKTERYLRIAFVPFKAADLPPERQNHKHRHGHQHSLSSQQQQQSQSPPNLQDSTEQQRTGFEPGSPPPSSSLASPTSINWYRKLAHAWNSTTGGSSSGSSGATQSSPGSSPNALDNEDAMSTPRRISHTQHDRCRLPTRRRQSTVQPFRITAQVFAASEAYSHSPSSLDSSSSSSIPAPMSFPVVLGICDSSRNLDLVPEGWATIGLSQGPASSLSSPASSNKPFMMGVADIILAASAACMDL